MNKIHNRSVAIIIILVITSVLFSQGLQETPRQTVNHAIDAKGRTVTINQEIESILIPGRAALMPADALYLFFEANQIPVTMSNTNQGLGDFYDLIIPKQSQQERISQQISIEQIVALKPSLVITKTNNYEALSNKLDLFGIPLFYMDLESSQQWKDEITQLGSLLGNPDRAEQINLFYYNREKIVTDMIKQIDEQKKPSVLILQVATSDGATTFSVAPSTWIQTEMVKKAGGLPIWTDSALMEHAWKIVTFEQIANWNPDVIYLVQYRQSPANILSDIYANERWNLLDAVKNNRVKAIPADYVSYGQPDSRWILALEFIAADLHPKQFPLFDMESQIRSFYQDLYHIQDKQVLDTIIEAYRKY
ncbi:MAG: ABC transporter substrate-binding protein [Sphaerochaetaceae bacterium]|jgi:iron complex transport system substrate-binding protein|nr:ABC transporter substrate-binding protein [Sphaerochaetaceae bacterium]NLO59811.1 ABC transporter substrate-binding protein [Spirochaetales bacterium]MDD2406898.1 ABC transporter substrate-binding protein [Sphaerochaetaceae bacterium]MDD4259485.1 ABC transporter substrate-binding protein [Sphaerochaetaceae bacterium]MDD4841204.1 ABC transporter substrate-binding protein [Sphaerochaetaceae bacterium]